MIQLRKSREQRTASEFFSSSFTINMHSTRLASIYGGENVTRLWRGTCCVSFSSRRHPLPIVDISPQSAETTKSMIFSRRDCVRVAFLRHTSPRSAPHHPPGDIPPPPPLQYELLYKVAETESNLTTAQCTANLDVFLRRSSELQYWVVTELVLCSNLSKRAQLLRKFIKVAAQSVAF